MNRLNEYSAVIGQLCQRHRVKTLYAFGSVLTEDFGEKSDVDLVVDFGPIAVDDYADNYFDLKFSLQDVLQRPVDLLEEQALHNPYFRRVIQQQKQLIYAR